MKNPTPGLALIFCLVLARLPAATVPPPPRTAIRLVELSTAHPEELRAAIEADFTPEALNDGTAWSGHGADFFFAVSTKSQPSLMIDDRLQTAMIRIGGSDLWYATTKIPGFGHAHVYHYLIDGQPFGGSWDLPVLGPLSYLQPGVPSGRLSEKLVHTSKIYDGMKSEYWIYVPAQYDPGTAAALMVFQDGGGYLDRDGYGPALNAIDNLIAQKLIPVMICVFINPGDISGSPGTPTYQAAKAYEKHWPGRPFGSCMRSVLYDTVSDRYPRFLRDEIIPELAKAYHLRSDSYSHAITGGSSGGISSFNAAWQMPEVFSRVLSWIGSFTSIQWKEDPAVEEGGQDYPDKVLRGPHRNIRVWLQDGNHDMSGRPLEVWWGPWPLANLRMAQALKFKDYDFHFSFGQGTHSGAQGQAEFPASMIWLWRDYDPAKTEQSYTMEPEEKAKPPFLVKLIGR